MQLRRQALVEHRQAGDGHEAHSEIAARLPPADAACGHDQAYRCDVEEAQSDHAFVWLLGEQPHAGRMWCRELAFRKRAEERGNYLLQFGKAGGFADTQELMDCIGGEGCYRPTLSEVGFLAATTHISGVAGVAPPRLARPNKGACVLKDSVLGHMAKMELVQLSYYLNDILPHNSPFEADMLVKGKRNCALTTCAYLVEEELEELNKQTSASEVAGCGRVLEAAKKQQRREAIEKARQVLEKKKAERLTTRTLKLGQSGTCMLDI